MPDFLKPEEFDASYFDGKSQRFSHNAGYGRYERHDGFRQVAEQLTEKYDLVGKRVLDVGCAKGFVVETMRKLGVDAQGVDVSHYALDNSPEAVRYYLQQADITEGLDIYSDKEFDFLFSLRVLECLDDENLAKAIRGFNRISKKQYHYSSERENNMFYASRTEEVLLKADFNKGTELSTRGFLRGIKTK